MPRVKASRSWSTPQKASSLVSPSGREKPVPMASRNTRSVLSIRLSALGPTSKGALWVACGLSVRTRTGPSEPMCSHSVEEPGPPL